ncbi:CRISPR-associated endonuclease/helicase Cas3 [Methylomarinovum caldicuralii]|uniref:CRISPR-associated endonuclease/helicase Cas3 n=1 Tax=Methylomarinovum caldicuralii TaxID=438856 RepID=A0AAU9CSZ3_9GAMM|nr:CRISPR-associated helicase Cas3' [Methylomarinovum caldicuralii]BCX82602.1 CRISPR-associated endonuclease/helicase Cas3 [Methylomarinovum caldicuralii]
MRSSECVFWGKYDPNGPSCLPLTAHCIDVAIVFRHLVALPGVRRALEHAAGRPLTEVELDRLAVLAALHDVGKANLGFQFKVFDPKAPQAGHIRELEILFEDEVLNERFAEAIEADVLLGWVEEGIVLESLLLASWSHHGRPLCFKGEKTGFLALADRFWQPREGRDPMRAVADIMTWCRRVFPEAFEAGRLPLPSQDRFHHLFAGLVMLADWLGSHPSWFPIVHTKVAQRWHADETVVPKLLRAVGLDVSTLRPVLARGPTSFQARFGFPPRPLQALIDGLDPEERNNRLVIAESETGSGKTEAALDWFFKLFAAGKVDSLYFALPTRVAARELYLRVWHTLQRWFPDPERRPVTLLAVPGYARVDGAAPAQVLPDEQTANLWQDDPKLRHWEHLWAAEHPKRFLAAMVAVGTIDQALLSVVQTSHAHLRSACLDRSLLVVDEVHASDIYMGRLLEHLLDHHLRIGGHAMLLSATLGASARARYLAVAAGRPGRKAEPPEPDVAQAQPYPALTLADGTMHPAESSEAGKAVVFTEVPLAFQPEALAPEIGKALGAGARVLVVLNTVARANVLLRALETQLEPDWLFRCHGVVCPHHGRFAPADRVVLDAAVSRRFGREGEAGPVLLIGTQTLEQSLDIDADWLVTDLAPADVLLQRVGRLHRHPRLRPTGFDHPRCHILVPEESLEAALDEKGRVAAAYKGLGHGSVYVDLRSLEMTRRFLARQPRVEIPRDNRRLVEQATNPRSLAQLQGDQWQGHGQAIEGEELAKAIAAGQVTVPFDCLFGDFQFNESGGKVAVRLGAGSWQLPVDRPFTSPFGQTVDEVLIPAHMAPGEPDEIVTVEEIRDGRVRLCCRDRSMLKNDRHYVYSRFGLEVET